MVIIISTTIYYLVCILTKKYIAFLSNAEEAKEKAYDWSLEECLKGIDYHGSWDGTFEPIGVEETDS